MILTREQELEQRREADEAKGVLLSGDGYTRIKLLLGTCTKDDLVTALAACRGDWREFFGMVIARRDYKRRAAGR